MKQVLSICNSTEAQGDGWSSSLVENLLILFSPQLAIGQCVLPLVEPAQYNLQSHKENQFLYRSKNIIFLELTII